MVDAIASRHGTLLPTRWLRWPRPNPAVFPGVNDRLSDFSRKIRSIDVHIDVVTHGNKRVRVVWWLPALRLSVIIASEEPPI